jgi:hypothetical protein
MNDPFFIDTTDLEALNKGQSIMALNARCEAMKQKVDNKIKEAIARFYQNEKFKGTDSHKVTLTDIQQILVNMAHIGFRRGKKNSAGVKPILTPKLAWKQLCDSKKKHTNWLSSVKYRPYPNYIERALSALRVENTDDKVELFLGLVNNDMINFNGTLNQVINNIYNYADREMEFRILSEKVIELSRLTAELETKVMIQNTELKQLRNSGVLAKNATRIDQIINLQKTGYTILEIADRLNVSKATINRDLKKSKLN